MYRLRLNDNPDGKYVKEQAACPTREQLQRAALADMHWIVDMPDIGPALAAEIHQLFRVMLAAIEPMPSVKVWLVPAEGEPQNIAIPRVDFGPGLQVIIWSGKTYHRSTPDGASNSPRFVETAPYNPVMSPHHEVRYDTRWHVAEEAKRREQEA